MLIRRAEDRGHADHGWLRTWHTFSFSSYRDPDWVQHGSLRVLNDDLIAPHSGFPTHPHHEMEIITYPVAGELTHTDSMGHTQVIRPGEVQVMSAGTGLRHGEANRGNETARIIQSWILPGERGVKPRYDQKRYDPAGMRGQFRPVVSGDGREGSLVINADAVVSDLLLPPGETTSHEISGGQRAWLQVVTGSPELNGQQLKQGDGVALEAGEKLQLSSTGEDALLLLFEMSA